MTKTVTFAFTFDISWEPEDFDCADPENIDAFHDNEKLIQLSKDNLIDCMTDWVSDGGPLVDTPLVEPFVHRTISYFEEDSEDKYRQIVLSHIKEILND